MTQTTHSIILELGEPVASKLDAGAPVIIQARMACAEDCDLAGRTIALLDAAGHVIAAAPLADAADGIHAAELAFTAPAQTGAQLWSLVSPPDDVLHPQASLGIETEIKPHDTSLAVWDVPSPLQAGGRFTLTAGATCTSGCNLAGREVEIHDVTGNIVARGTLGGTVWPQTQALYFTELSLTAPDTLGRASWSLHFVPKELHLPHGAAAYNFGAEIVARPEHVVTVKVLEKESGAPLEGALVRLGVFAAHTGQDGVARVETPKGRFELDVLKTDYQTRTDYDCEPLQVAVAGDMDVTVAMKVVPKENPDAYWYHNPDKG